ncbi:uncharacterized protein BT62DRAFT_930169 [Guyanagaster necrorhizus]|uniref:DUF1776-domain-containing protein n=1 Tax=Guyanagaster necrorhizus TaxID=856835 RepID=A0A9P8AUI3_9AGAR|nr:uncharacterized protein BT62DRAFT_930169 [Guyanagaster necrorhizus MCA 3950]KAG7448086.1 hypothetical protein BT62DRAFT_930169 [Guyanagaster necrorhizus MCA 3950]
MDKTMDMIEDYLDSLEEILFSSLSAATPDIPRIRDSFNQLWTDVSRYGPGIPKHIPGLGDFEVPPPPPPPPPPATWVENTTDWIERNPWTTGGIAVGIISTGLLVGYGGVYMRTVRARRLKALATEKRQVVVVLGGDTPFGLPLISDLEQKGYIVIASVSTPEAADLLERQSHGFVRALVLDPTEPSTIPVFLRSLSSTLSRRFPLNAPGDPFTSPASHPYIHAVVSLLSLAGPALHAPFEHISLQSDYLPYLTSTQITPLQVIQSLLPLLRNVPSKGKKPIVICLPATDARVGLPFSSLQSMSAASTLRAVEVLRREIQVAALTGKTEAMRNISVVVADVGSFNVGVPMHFLPPEDVYKTMEDWSVSEKITYGPGFAAMAQQSITTKSKWDTFTGYFQNDVRYGVARKPTDVKIFVDNIVDVVTNGQFGWSFLGFNLCFGVIKNWLRGERFSVGAGAHTYKLASVLPSLILDTLLNIPYFLISVRNALLPAQPFIRTPPTMDAFVEPQSEPHVPALSQTEGEDDNESGSEADVESNSGEGSTASWVRLKKSVSEEANA